MAEHGLDGPVIGVAFDGTGYGTDGTIWGGEFLIADYQAFERASHLRAVPLPGGDRAAKETWRMALSYLVDAGIEPPDIIETNGSDASTVVLQMIHKRINAPLTSSAGRLFDAVSSLIGRRHRVSYEGQAAMELEWLCEGRLSDRAYPFDVDDAVVTRPLIRALMEDVEGGVPPAEIARRFHKTMVAIIEDVCERLREAHGLSELSRVVLSGGVFQNALLTESTIPALERRGFAVYRHVKVPPNDGGLSLGQLAVASENLSCV
jgi:hydrogenase maturation protein HypF